ncbi:MULTISPECIES: non-ribosomal peptide synthetase [Photorhabdus]|uniref:Amino acid adenylation domain-containing protein n=1 Tax=Photorhabdus luminescens TaxID=29488 RepID=A0A1G5PWL4_PHOLU|nr:non-ribosomal peptide synthetase [Photorhabdus luminescens]SCZ53650.1 amino acid adenylation domain-containing protein [Photorhabdus luminescens]
MYKNCPQTGDEELLSMQQRALWFIDNYTPGDSKYNISMAFRIHGSFQIDAFRYAVNRLVSKNAILRNTFVNVNGEPRLVINEHLPPVLEVFDATNLSQEALEDAVQNFHSIPFQLEKASCLRFGIYVVSAEEYVLHMCVHHIVSDFTSMGLMWDQLEHYYLAELGEDDDSWLPPAEDFKDYAVKEQEYYQSEAAEESKAYWSECLKQPPAVLQWDSFWRKGPNDKSSILFSIGEETTKKIKRLASKIGGSVFTVMLAAWSAYIARETKAADIVMGVPVSMRHSVHQHIIGCLFNTLPIRLSVGQTFHHFLLAAKEQLLSALDNRNFCLSQIVEHLAVERYDDRNPLFQAAVNMLGQVGQSRWVALEMADDSVQASWARRTISPFRVCQQEGLLDIELLFLDAGSYLRCEFKADKHFFSHLGLRIFAERFKQAIEMLIADPDEEINTLLAPKSEDYNLPSGPLNSGVLPEVSNQTLVSLFDQRVTQQAASVAIRYSADTLTYLDLQRWSLEVAVQLIQNGVVPGDRVGIALLPSLEAVVAMLGIMRAGAGYVPLDPRLPQNRLAQIVEQSEMKLIVVNADVDPDNECKAKLMTIAATESSLASGPVDHGTFDHATFNHCTPASIAYSVFTSGSTGIPKGIDVEHSSVVSCFKAMDEYLSPASGEVWTWFHAASFDLSVWEIWGALCSGGVLVIVPDDIRNQPDKLLDLIAAEQVTIITQTPSSLKSLLSEFQARPRSYAIKHWVICGEALLSATIRPYLNTRWTLWNMYGPAEATIYTTVEKVTEELTDYNVIPIGKPLNFATVYLLNPAGQTPPIGEIGEIYIGGRGVARGYVGLEQLTNQCFIADPYIHHGRIYKTGDLAYWDGERIHFCGRVDDQVKVSGYRIEIAEIEDCLNRHHAIADAAVIIESHEGLDRLVAIFVPVSKDSLPDESAIRDHLRAYLPTYMLPGRIMLADELPRNAHNKIDRRTLNGLIKAGQLTDISSLRLAPVLPADSIFAEISRIWCEVLGRATVGLDDAFFNIGGTSLALTQIHAQLVQLPGCDTLALSDLFRFPTIRKLANYFLSPLQPITPVDVADKSTQTRRQKTLNARKALKEKQTHLLKGEQDV